MTELLRLTNISKYYRQRRRHITAVEDVTLTLQPGEILCVVGESGSGKSTIGRIVTGLTEPTGGEIFYNGTAAREMTRRDLRRHRLGVQMIQQDPYASLNPGMTVEEALTAPLRRHYRISRREAQSQVSELLADVGLTPA